MWGRSEMRSELWLRKPDRKGPPGRRRSKWKVQAKINLNGMRFEYVICFRKVTSGLCERGKELPNFLKCVELFDSLRNG